MSSLTTSDIAEIARNRLGLAANEGARLETLVNSALDKLARKIARREDYQALRKELAVTSTAGVITLSDTTIISETLLETGELILNSKFAVRAPRYEDLRLKMPTDVYRWSLKTPTKIHVTDLVTGNLGVVAQTGTLACNYVPTLAELPPIFDNELIDDVVILASGKIEKPAAEPLNDNKGGVDINLK